MKLDGLSDKELNELEDKLDNETLTEEERKALTPEEPEDNSTELIVEIDDDPKGTEDNSAPNPPAPQDNQNSNPPANQQATEPPAPVTPAVSEEVYNKLITDYPQLAKFKNDENFITNLSKSYVNLESKVGSPQPEPTLPPVTDEQKLAQLNKDVLSEVERRMMNNPAVLDALTVRDENGNISEVLQLPRTPQELYKFKRENPAEYLEVKQIGDAMYSNVHREFTQNAQLAEQAPTANQATLDTFMDDVVTYCKKVAPNVTDEDMKIVGEKLHAFVGKTIPNGEYYDKKGNAYFLNGKRLQAEFLSSNAELIGKLAEINAKNSAGANVQQSVLNTQKQKSMKTLANAGLNAPIKRKIDLKRDLGKMSDAELDRLEVELLNK